MEKRTKRKNILSSFLTLLITAALLIGSMTTAVFGGDYEAGKNGNISLKLQETGDDGTVTPIPNVKLTLYKVGSVTFDGNVHFVLDSAFADTGIDFDELQNAEGWYSAATTLSEAVKESGISGIEMQSDEEGKIIYNDQAEGVYLIVQSDSDESVSVSPMLLTVPFAEEETGWTYDVQVYPKAVTNDRKETQIQVTKQLFYINEDFEIIEMEADDATYKIGVFLDKEGTIPFRSDYMKDIRIVNDHSGTAIWTDVPDGTYYVFELDENGNPMAANDTIEVESGKTFYYNVTDENGDESNEAVISQEDSTETVSYVNNYYYYIPDGRSLRGYISIKKKVLVDGIESTVPDTFYAGIFKTEEDGTRTLVDKVQLKQNGSVSVEVSFEADTEPDSVTYTVMETDKDGKPVDKSSFPYEVSGEEDIVLNKNENYKNEMEITNSLTTKPDPSVTPSQRTTTTPAPGNNYTPGGGNNPGGSTQRTSVKTGDDTPVGVWVGLLAAAVVIGGAAGFAVRRKKK